MARQRGPINLDRREFMKMAIGTGVVCAASSLIPDVLMSRTEQPVRRCDFPRSHVGRVDWRHIYPVGTPHLYLRRDKKPAKKLHP